MPESVLDRSSSPLDQGGHVLEDACGILGMEVVGPALRIGGHLLRRIAHDRPQVLTDESTGEIARGLGGVDDRRADGEQVLQALPRVAEFGFDRLALGDVRPGADQLRRMPGFVLDHLEGVLDPNVVPVAMLKAVLDRSSSPLDQRAHFIENSCGILGMEVVGPAPLVSDHLSRRIAHDGLKIFADEGAGKIARGLVGVDDGGTD